NEAARHDSNDLMDVSIQTDLLADDVRRTAIVRLPQVIADDRYAGCTETVLFGKKCAAHNRFHSECGEQVSRTIANADALRICVSARAHHGQIAECVSGHLFKARGCLLPIKEISRRYGHGLLVSYNISLEQSDETVRIRVRQRPDQ